MAKMKKVLPILLRGESSQDSVAAALHVSRRDVSSAAKAIREHGHTYDEVTGIDPPAVDDTFFPGKRGRKKDAAYPQLDKEAYAERKKRCHKLVMKQF